MATQPTDGVRYLLDTNVVSELSRPRPDPQVLGWLSEQSADDLFVSSFTPGEIQKGLVLLPPGKRRTTLAGWLEELVHEFRDRSVAVDVVVARQWGRVLAESHRTGRGLSFADAVLLATALIHKLVVVTRNVRDFRGRGVDVFNPWDR